MESFDKIEWLKESLLDGRIKINFTHETMLTLIRKESEEKFIELLIDNFDFPLRYAPDSVFECFLKGERYFRAGGEFCRCCGKIVFYVLTNTEVKTVVKK